MIYQQALDMAGDSPTPAQRSELRRLRSKLAEDFPGYSTAFTNDLPAVLEDLKRAAEDPVLAGTSAGQGLTIWLRAREMAEQAAQEQYGTGWTRAEAAAPIRAEMRRLADHLAGDFPGFEQIYDRALQREMVRDDA